MKVAGTCADVVGGASRAAEHELAEQASARLAQMFAALIATNEAILRAETRDELLQKTCEAVVLGGEFTIVAIGFAEQDSEFLPISKLAGPATEQGRDFRIALDPAHPERWGVGGTAFKTKTPCITNDYLNDERLAYWHKYIASIGTRSSAAWPLFKNGESAGVLWLASSEANVFTPELIALMQRVAENVSLALANFDRVEEKAQADERIKYLATHDGLTGLANRAMFGELLSASLETSQRLDRQFALLFIDLDRFKIINDSLGHADGDRLLVEVARRLRECVGDGDAVARLGGDEFVVIVENITRQEEATAIAQKIRSAVLKPLSLSGQECHVTASIGIAMFPVDGRDEQTLTKNADLAMYLAKTNGKNDVRLFSNDLKTQSLEHLMLETALRHALERHQMVLYYQPKRELATNQVTGVEALLRWMHPDLGLLLPNQFIPLAEELGLIVEIDHWSLITACKQNMSWQAQGLRPLSLAINLSKNTFMDGTLLKNIDKALARSGMPAELLQLEITEAMIMQNVDRAMEVLGAIKSRGIRLAVDDFGTGYSSMSSIKQFPVDTLKIDRSFIRNLLQDSGEKPIANAIICLGKALGLKIVAEGVETIEQESFLREHACDEMQGYLLSQALPVEEIPSLVQAIIAPPLQPSVHECHGNLVLSKNA